MDLTKIRYTPILLGVNDKMIRWTILIGTSLNSKEFSYSQGLGYLTTQKQLKLDNVPANERNYFSFKTDNDLKQVLIDANSRKLYNEVSSFNHLAVKNPKLEDVLYCLFLDAQAHDSSFESWCFDFGYDNDSIKAKKTYDLCIDNYFKLRDALGQDFNNIKNYIESLDL